MNVKNNILIFSVFQKNQTEESNKAAHVQVLQALRDSGIPSMELQGKYNGTPELSILVDGFEYRQTVEKACKAFNQECYLESHNDRATSLVFPDGSRQHIGTLVAASQSEAEASGSYSYNPIIKQHFIVR